MALDRKCAWCGKTYGSRVTEMIRCYGDEPRFETNHERVGGIQSWTSTDGRRVHAAKFWDGESYWMPYKPFCTLRCAFGYARRAYEHNRRFKR